MAVTVLYFQGVVIGLEVSAMTVSESSGSIEAVVKVLSGVLSTPVMVTFSTLSRTALGQSWATNYLSIICTYLGYCMYVGTMMQGLGGT